jgi:hypothetical protein
MEFNGQYLTYEEFLALGGSLDLAPFNLLEFEARKEIDKRTQGRLINLESQSQSTKMCMFQLINLLISINNGIEINGNVVNYTHEQIVNTKVEIIRKYLLDEKLEDGTPYLYCGVE